MPNELDSIGPICLIIPPSVFLLDERVFMTLGVLRVAACLEEAGYTVEMLDLSGIENYLAAVEAQALATSARTFGFTATTPQMPAALQIAQRLRALRPDARLILGGPHVTLVNAAVKRERARQFSGRAQAAFDRLQSAYDVLVAGDGEAAVFQALPRHAPKLVDGDDPSSPLFLNNQKLNALPFPARHLVDASSYHYTIDGVPALSLIAQLGCPFECGFCGGRESPMLRRVRMRTAQNVIDEMLTMHFDHKINGFMLYDDELNVNPGMVELMNAIADAQSHLGVQWHLRGFVKAQLFTDAQAEAMVRAGFRWILTGFESGDPRILRNINKRSTRDENTRCVEIARRHGLKVKALMSIGHPGETEESVRETHRWLLEAQPDDFDVSIITTYPGTPYYDRATPHPERSGVWVYSYPATGDRLYSYEVDYTEVADYYKGKPGGGYKSYVFTDGLTADQLVTLRDFVERDVRQKCRIPFNPAKPPQRFEHTMGQFGLPEHILRVSTANRSFREPAEVRSYAP
ncbi:MAG: B12-binding domain-containing radical SAM protein [Acidobacteria bacterium]|nr:B12-binding domain-containing radical SAM protein [Acidobacteriota bacterium]MBI3656474.1 B12-binding domain-containing radical SAM protein [Acidobacteriota bacterium]